MKIVGSRASLRGPSESSVVLVRVEDGGIAMVRCAEACGFQVTVSPSFLIRITIL